MGLGFRAAAHQDCVEAQRLARSDVAQAVVAEQRLVRLRARRRQCQPQRLPRQASKSAAAPLDFIVVPTHLQHHHPAASKLLA